MSIKILFLGPLPAPPRQAGTPAAIAQLLTGLVARGFKVHVLAPALVDCSAELRQVGEIPGTRTTYYPMRGVLYDYRSAAALDMQYRAVHAALPALLELYRFDVLFVGHAGWLDGVPRLARRHEMPVLLWAHSELRPDAPHRIGYSEPHAQRITRQVGDADLVVAVAEHLREGLAACGACRLAVVPNGVDTNAFRPLPRDPALQQALRIDAGDIIVLHASTLLPVKRVDDLVRSAALALGQDARLCYLILGGGADCEPLLDAAERLGIAERCRFPGWIDRALMPAWLGLADIVAMPSATEGMSLVYLEAMAAGKVLIASDIPAAREVLRDGENGLLFPMGDVAALAAVTARAAADPVLRQCLGRAARVQAERRHDVASAVDAFARIIERTVAGDLGAFDCRRRD